MPYPDDVITHQEAMEIVNEWLYEDNHGLRIPASGNPMNGDFFQGLWDSLRTLHYEHTLVAEAHPWGDWNVRGSYNTKRTGCTTCRTTGPCATMKILDIEGPQDEGNE